MCKALGLIPGAPKMVAERQREGEQVDRAGMEGKGTVDREGWKGREQKCRKQALSTSCVHCHSGGNVRKPRNPHKCCHSYANHGKNLRVVPWTLGSQGSHCHCDKEVL